MEYPLELMSSLKTAQALNKDVITSEEIVEVLYKNIKNMDEVLSLALGKDIFHNGETLKAIIFDSKGKALGQWKLTI